MPTVNGENIFGIQGRKLYQMISYYDYPVAAHSCLLI